MHPRVRARWSRTLAPCFLAGDAGVAWPAETHECRVPRVVCDAEDVVYLFGDGRQVAVDVVRVLAERLAVEMVASCERPRPGLVVLAVWGVVSFTVANGVVCGAASAVGRDGRASWG